MSITLDDSFLGQIRCADQTETNKLRCLQVYLGLRNPVAIEEQELYYAEAQLLRSTPYYVEVAKNRRFVARCIRDFSVIPFSQINEYGDQVWRSMCDFISEFRAVEEYTEPQYVLIEP